MLSEFLRIIVNYLASLIYFGSFKFIFVFEIILACVFKVTVHDYQFILNIVFDHVLTFEASIRKK